MTLIGICGLIGAGKDTIAARLVNNWRYERTSWATPLKDITATLFGWDRDMMEGATPESRALREIPDPWWSEKFGVDWTPRLALQRLGTDVLREHLHQDIWILASMKRIQGKENIVIPDTRFPNEVAAIKKMGGEVWRVKRGEDPTWYTRLSEIKEEHMLGYNRKMRQVDIDNWMLENYPDVHASEYSWHESDFDNVLENDGTIEDLNRKVDSIIGYETMSVVAIRRDR